MIKVHPEGLDHVIEVDSETELRTVLTVLGQSPAVLTVAARYGMRKKLCSACAYGTHGRCTGTRKDTLTWAMVPCECPLQCKKPA